MLSVAVTGRGQPTSLLMWYSTGSTRPGKEMPYHPTVMGYHTRQTNNTAFVASQTMTPQSWNMRESTGGYCFNGVLPIFNNGVRRNNAGETLKKCVLVWMKGKWGVGLEGVRRKKLLDLGKERISVGRLLLRSLPLVA